MSPGFLLTNILMYMCICIYIYIYDTCIHIYIYIHTYTYIYGCRHLIIHIFGAIYFFCVCVCFLSGGWDCGCFESILTYFDTTESQVYPPFMAPLWQEYDQLASSNRICFSKQL